MSKTLYDILEVSKDASPESIRAAYERLSAKYSDDSAIPDAKLRSTAVTEAFLTLSTPAKRAQYDKTLAERSQAVIYGVEESEPFWTLSKLLVLLLVVAVLGGFLYKQNREREQLEAERAIAVAKAKEAAEKARIEAMEQQAELEKNREEALQAEREQRERAAAIRQLDYEQRRMQNMSASSERRKALKERAERQQRQREEAAAAAAVRQRLARDKAELCRLEREHYGRAISCY